MTNAKEITREGRETRLRLRRETAAWQGCAVGLFALSITVSVALSGLYAAERRRWEAETEQLNTQLERAAAVRDHAVQELGALAAETARERQARQEQEDAYEALGEWEYLGEFTITACCPCEECCGRWADGVTASGIQAGPGIVAVDPDVIPLGSTVIINGQRYLAADTGVTGQNIDVCMTSHRATVKHGVKTSGVWVVVP